MEVSGEDFDALSSPKAIKQQFKEAGILTLDREQFIAMMARLNPGFGEDGLAKLADGAVNRAFTGAGKIFCSALVDWLFGGGFSSASAAPPKEIVMGDLGSGKTTAYLFRRTDDGAIECKELTDGGVADLPSLSSVSFEEWTAAFTRAAGDYYGHYPVHIGATQWYREMPEDKQVDLGLRLWAWGEQSFPHGFRLLEVSGMKEATCEATACRHACAEVLKRVPGIILSAGTGSMQCTSAGVSESISLDTKAWSKRSAEELPVFREAAKEALGPLRPLLQQRTELALFLGASWYAVVTAGMAEQKSAPFLMPRMEAIRKLEACATNPETSMRNAVNIWRIIECLQMAASAETVAFARNWKVNGQDFRTTWSAGYFLEGCA
jgi:hypothetical protein